VVALIADLESAVLWWNILPMLGPPAASAFPAAAISACARRRGWSHAAGTPAVIPGGGPLSCRGNTRTARHRLRWL